MGVSVFSFSFLYYNDTLVAGNARLDLCMMDNHTNVFLNYRTLYCKLSIISRYLRIVFPLSRV
jgi:hypothetical protein